MVCGSWLSPEAGLAISSFWLFFLDTLRGPGPSVEVGISHDFLLLVVSRQGRTGPLGHSSLLLSFDPVHGLTGHTSLFAHLIISYRIRSLFLCLLAYAALASSVFIRALCWREGNICQTITKSLILSLILPLIVVCVMSWQGAQNKQRVNVLWCQNPILNSNNFHSYKQNKHFFWPTIPVPCLMHKAAFLW